MISYMSSYRRRLSQAPELLVVLGGLPLPTPKNLQEAYQSRTAHHVLIYFARRNPLVLDLLRISQFFPFRSFHHVVR